MLCKVFDLGLVEFRKALDFQGEIFLRIKSNELSAALILCQHYPVITLGRVAKKESILAQEAELKRANIELYDIERGGDVTYHGPGQLVIYPVLNLNYFRRDIHWFLRQLEELAIKVLDSFGIKGGRVKDKTGVWVGGRKIVSVGIAIKNWITFHGLAINVKENDLDNFTLIKPCGMDIMMTSMETILQNEVMIEEVKTAVIKENFFKGD